MIRQVSHTNVLQAIGFDSPTLLTKNNPYALSQTRLDQTLLKLPSRTLHRRHVTHRNNNKNQQASTARRRAEPPPAALARTCCDVVKKYIKRTRKQETNSDSRRWDTRRPRKERHQKSRERENKIEKEHSQIQVDTRMTSEEMSPFPKSNQAGHL